MLCLFSRINSAYIFKEDYANLIHLRNVMVLHDKAFKGKLKQEENMRSKFRLNT